MLITPEYRELQRELHDAGAYGVSGAKWAPTVHRLAKGAECRTVLDYGSGKGSLSRVLPRMRRYEVREYDPAIPGKDEMPEPADLVFCGDVLEHIEPECLNDVLDHLRALTLRVAFLVIATRPAIKSLSDGRNAHLIVQPAWWWLPRLATRWDMDRFHGGKGEFEFYGLNPAAFAQPAPQIAAE